MHTILSPIANEIYACESDWPNGIPDRRRGRSHRKRRYGTAAEAFFQIRKNSLIRLGFDLSFVQEGCRPEQENARSIDSIQRPVYFAAHSSVRALISLRAVCGPRELVSS